MKMRSLKRYLYSATGLLLLLILVMGILTWRACQQSLLNQTLIQAVRHNDTERVKDLLKQGADPNARGGLFDFTDTWHPSLLDIVFRREPNTQFPALMIAAFNGDAESVRALVERGAEVNKVMPAGSNVAGYTALIYAANRPESLPVKILLEHGANVHIKARDGLTPLKCATKMQYKDTIRLLKQAGATE